MYNSDNFERFFGDTIVHQNLKKNSIRAALFMAIGQGANFLLKFISIIILARLLLPEYFGLVAMVTAVTGIAEVMSDLGLSTATIQRNDINHEQVSNLFWINATAGILFFLFFSAISILISEFYSDHRLISITIAISTNFLWSGLKVQHQALLSRQLKQGQISLILLSADLFSILSSILLAISGYEYWALVWREVIRNVLNTSGIWLFCPWIPGLPKRNVGTREFLRFGRDLSLTHLITGLISKIDGLLIGRFFGAATLGIYRQAYQLLVVPIQQIMGPILSVAQPGLSRLQSDPERYRRYYKKLLFFISLTTIPIGIFIAVYARELVLFLLGVKWIEATPILRIFAILAAILPAISTYTVVLITCGKPRKFLLVALVHSVVLIIFMIIGLQWGAIGIAIAHAATSAILMVPKLYYSFAGTPVTIMHFMRATESPLIAGVIMTAVLYFLTTFITFNNLFFTLLLGSVTGVLIYGAIIFLLTNSRNEVITLYRDVVVSFRRKTLYEGNEELKIAKCL